MTDTSRNKSNDEQKVVWSMLCKVFDPEIPVVSIVDLGIVREVDIIKPGEHISITVTPTYSGCPATDVINTSIRLKLLSHGYRTVDVVTVLAPAWTTDWITDEGKEKMKEYGIAPPDSKKVVQDFFAPAPEVHCPRCNSLHTHIVSEFGSTACKALYKCDECMEPFDVFKCH